MVMGSPSYIAPETWRGESAQVDGRADLFSLSVIVFRWLTGKLPFDAPDLVGKMMAVTSGPRPSAMSLNADLHPAVDAWIARALAIAPADRFQSGQELYDALSLALTGSATVKRPVTPSTKPKPLVDAQQIFAKALQSAGDLLKRFTHPEPAKSTASPAPAATKAQAPEAPPAPHKAKTVWLDSKELEAVPHKANTVWLDSKELEAVPHKANTVWLDSSELSDVPREAAVPRKANTVWLDSSELSDVPRDAVTPEAAAAEPTTLDGAAERAEKPHKGRVTERKKRHKSPGSSRK
jgi:serine/threonine protein kinase